MDKLVVTGRLAENAVRKSVRDEADVLVLDLEVAAFITPALLRRHLPDKKYDLILIPGLASGDFSPLEEERKTTIRLGPKHAVDLDFVLSFAEDATFSRKVPACELLMEKKRANAFETIARLEEKSASHFLVRGVKIGGESRMKVMAEIVDAGHLSGQELISKIQYFHALGADIIDLGLSLDTGPEEVRTCVKTARSTTDIPLSVDTLDPELINTALDSGVDMVLSLNSENMEETKKNILQSSAAAVIIPDCVDDIESLFGNLESARNSGMTRIIADPVLEPIGQGLVDAITRYDEFRERDRSTPLFFGTGNVTELIDADSIGVNAVLAGMAMELDASIVFTPDFSPKTYNGVAELRTASMMMMLARERRSPPKDLGIDLLATKEKRRREFSLIPNHALAAEETEEWHLDPAGCFRITITHEEIRNAALVPGRIVAESKNATIAGNTAKEVLDTILRLGLVSRLDHAAYLGRELMKAELALKFKRSYSQDDKF